MVERDIKFNCNETHCTITKEDARWMVARDMALSQISEELVAALKSCKWKKA
jgi:hypothetical protein